MIETLRIRELALVEAAEIDFGRGLNVLTGETGAGKSIVLGALGLLAGARAAADQVREGAAEASVEAVFRTEGLDALEAALAERGLEGDAHELVVRRSVAAGGRSRAQVAGRLVPIGALVELFGGRVEVSSQHESQALLRPEVQGRLLDAYGGLEKEREAVRAGVAALRERDAEIARLRERAAERAREEDFLAHQVQEIDAAELEAGEDERLEAEHRRLVHAERLRGDAQRAGALLAGDPAASDAPGATDLLAEALRLAEGLAEIDPALEALAGRLRDAHAEAGDASADLARYAEGVEAEPGRLATLEERLQTLERLRRKYGRTAEAILAFRERAAAELAEIGGADERIRELEAEREAERARLASAAEALTRGRERAAQSLGKAATDGLASLAMAEARLEVALEPAPAPEGLPCGPTGAEAPELRFSANPGEAPRSLRRVASGGELSRVFLALKNVLRRAERGMVLVFDEVDAGIGGRAADRVGRVLADLASEHQVLCITHLPQIAARADRHLRVAKAVREGRTRTEVEALSGEARVEEIARMAGGEEVTDATRRHARSLLSGEGAARAARR